MTRIGHPRHGHPAWFACARRPGAGSCRACFDNLLPDLTWYLIRHGETEWNAVSRMQGQLDSALTPRGRAQVTATADLLARVGVDVLFASPLGRVRATVDILNERLALPVRFDDRLKEWSAGDWAGELYSEIGGKWPVEWAAWQADRVTHASPGGENFLNLPRAHDVPRRRRRTSIPQQSVGLSRGFINRALAAVLLDQPLRCSTSRRERHRDSDSDARRLRDSGAFRQRRGPAAGPRRRQTALAEPFHRPADWRERGMNRLIRRAAGRHHSR